MMGNSDNVIYANVVEEMSDGVLIIGFDGKIRSENAVVSEILGFSKESLYGRTIASIMQEDDKNDEFFRCIIDAVYTKKKIRETVPYYINGERKFLRIVTSFLRDTKDDVALITLIGDITELVELDRKNQELNEKLISFLDNFVNIMISAIDERTPYNATHTKKMAGYAVKYLDWLSREGRLENYEYRNPFLASVWLHDIGKLVIPSEIMDKPTRLAERESVVLGRIELATVCEKLKAVQSPEYAEEAKIRIEKLKAAAELVKTVNKSGYVDEVTRQKIEEISKIECLNSAGESVPLLDPYEKEALSVRKGTLTYDERLVMESHVKKTYDMLTQLHFEGIYDQVPKWASSHHEYLDGSGYPDRIKAKDIPWEVRVLTVIDIYDALTAEDRPYKPPMPPERAFGILRDMVKEGKLDSEVVESFCESEAWK